jgi:DNA-binding CsgD family transcriptional regulator
MLSTQSPCLNLSPREREIMELLSRGRSDKEIASDLGIAVRTITTHLSRIYDKLQVPGRVGAVLKWRDYVISTTRQTQET